MRGSANLRLGWVALSLAMTGGAWAVGCGSGGGGAGGGGGGKGGGAAATGGHAGSGNAGAGDKAGTGGGGNAAGTSGSAGTGGSGSCTTSFPGRVLFDFDGGLTPGWGAVVDGDTASSGLTGSFGSTVTDGHACPGAIKLDIPFTVYGSKEAVSATFNYASAVDWTGFSKLHFWIKIETSTIAELNGVQPFVESNGYLIYTSQFANASPLFANGDWQEVVLDFTASTNTPVLTAVNQLGVQTLLAATAPASGPATPSSVTVLVDDIWLEAAPSVDGGAGAGGSGGAAGTAGHAGTGGSAGGGASGSGGAAVSGNSAGVHVVGTQLYDATMPIRLMGVNRPGGEYACLTGNVWDPADGSGNNAATIATMLTWKVNAVRIPLNEDCWLSLNSTHTAGAAYQSAIQTWVNLLLQNNIYPILELHWTENNGAQATGQQPMPDLAHAPTFWGQVAAAYANSPKVIFDLFNEPYPDNNMEATAAWTCWRDGGTCTGITYQVAGMQSMVTAVRNAGASNLIVLGGVEYSNDLTQWLTYKPTDPANNLAASWHVYPNSNYTSNHTLLMDANGVAGVVPIVATEIGDANCTAGGTDNGSFITSVMTYLDGLDPPQSYLAWSWSTDDQPILISSYNGTATCEGTTYKAHLLATPH